MFCNSAIESWCFWQICYCTILLARYFLEVLEKKRPYLDIKNVCNVYETVCSPSTKCLTRYCRMKCQDFSLSYQNRAVGSCENPGRPIVIDCLSLLLYFWCTANVYRQTTDELTSKSVTSRIQTICENNTYFFVVFY